MKRGTLFLSLFKLNVCISLGETSYLDILNCPLLRARRGLTAPRHPGGVCSVYLLNSGKESSYLSKGDQCYEQNKKTADFSNDTQILWGSYKLLSKLLSKSHHELKVLRSFSFKVWIRIITWIYENKHFLFVLFCLKICHF